ncbi:hypothetical protein LJC49_03060 [Ruminococcaceae bacterium OttesenSCG-928-I18]|nr:hypothetical protein [Ruminococcaceae bacterium OttesenSCG-928-I18]
MNKYQDEVFLDTLEGLMEHFNTNSRTKVVGLKEVAIATGLSRRTIERNREKYGFGNVGGLWGKETTLVRIARAMSREVR